MRKTAFLSDPVTYGIIEMYTVSLTILRIYGFYDECKRRYSIKLWKTFTDCFNCLPLGTYLINYTEIVKSINFILVVAMVEDKILCMHGGVSPDLKSLDQVFTRFSCFDVHLHLSVWHQIHKPCFNVLILFDNCIKPVNCETLIMYTRRSTNTLSVCLFFFFCHTAPWDRTSSWRSRSRSGMWHSVVRPRWSECLVTNEKVFILSLP